MATNDDNRSNPIKRRDLLKVITAAGSAALVSVTPSPAHEGTLTQAGATTSRQTAPAASAVYQRKFFDEHEWKTVRVLSDYIIPADERSGSATAAGVPEFIDDWLDFKRSTMLAPEIRGGLVWLDLESNRKYSHDFVDCTETQQREMLDRIAYPKKALPEDAAGVAFLNRMRDLVASGFFSSEIGVKDLPYLGNQMLAEWDGCGSNVIAKLGLEKG